MQSQSHEERAGDNRHRHSKLKRNKAKRRASKKILESTTGSKGIKKQWFDFEGTQKIKQRMKFCVSSVLLSQLVVVFLLILLSYNYTDTDESTSYSHPQFSFLSDRKGLASSILSFSFSSLPLLSPKPIAKLKLIAALNGKISLVESHSGNVIWSFYTNSPIYHSYQSRDASEFIECGDDWELILHNRDFGTKKRLSESVVDYFSSSPTISKDGSVIFTTKSGGGYVVDATTGWPFGIAPHAEFILHIFRANYFLKSVGPKPGSKIALWTMRVSEFKAILVCRGGNDNDLNFAMPYACGDQIPIEVFRRRR